MLVNKKCPLTLELAYNDDRGNVLWLKCAYDDHTFMLGVIYGPNEDSPMFFQDLFNFYQQSGVPECIITGDFNVTLNHEDDNYGYVAPRNVNARTELNKLNNDMGFVDAHRELHGKKKLFTWIRNGGPQRARLDMFLISESLRPYIFSSETGIPFKSDHMPIILKIDFSRFKRGKGFWKHNSALLQDLEYLSRMNVSFKETCAKYFKHPNYENFLEESTRHEYDTFLNLDLESMHLLEYNVNPNMLLNMILNDARNETISYSTAKRLTENHESVRLLSDLTTIKNKIASNNTYPDIQIDLESAERLYNKHIDLITSQTYTKNRITNKISGEKPTKFFCNLEKNFNAQKYISKLNISDSSGTQIIITNQTQIELEIKCFYEKLYSNCDDEITKDMDDFVDMDVEYDKLDNVQMQALEHDITLDELNIILKNTKNDSTPGSSGFTYAFYKVFWKFFGPLIVKSANYSFSVGILPESQTVGIISLIPKGDKPKQFLDNWRPITLQNSIYKLISGVIAKRINGVLPDIIHSDQSGFVNGRYIGDCIRNTYDILQWAKTKKRRAFCY